MSCIIAFKFCIAVILVLWILMVIPGYVLYYLNNTFDCTNISEQLCTKSCGCGLHNNICTNVGFSFDGAIKCKIGYVLLISSIFPIAIGALITAVILIVVFIGILINLLRAVYVCLFDKSYSYNIV